MRSKLQVLLILFGLLAGYSPAVGLGEIKIQAYQKRLDAWEMHLNGLEYRQNEIIVQFDDAALMSEIDEASLQGFTIENVFQYRPIAVFKITSAESTAEALARLEGTPGIRGVEPNLIRRCTLVPNDVLFNRQEYLTPIHATAAWDITIGSPEVDVAVIDTGIDIEHPEFAGKITWVQNFFDGDTVGVNNVFDDSGHGTAVAGIIAAQGNNSIGIAGMGWDIRIMSFRACGGPNLTCTIADEIQSLDAAVAHGAKVINLSLGGVGTTDSETKAIADAHASGAVLVAAAGNEGKLYVATGDPSQDKQNLFYPAAYPEVIGVAALDNQDGSIVNPDKLGRASWSNYGESIVSVAAVGTGIETTVPYRPKSEVPYAFYPSPNYSKLLGTSFACPQVAGLACLLFSKYPQLGPSDVQSLIELNAHPLGGPDNNGNGVDDYLGHGVIDASASLGTSTSQGSVHENEDFLIGITASPIMDNEFYVVVKCKKGSDKPPSVSYFVKKTAENAAVQMELLPAQTNTYLGRFFTLADTQMTIQLSGVLNGFPLQPLSFVFPG
jgi:subtilisin family serine protease